MKNLIASTIFALSLTFAAFATNANGPKQLTDEELGLVQGGAELAICCDECHGHGGGVIHCTGCRFCIIVAL